MNDLPHSFPGQEPDEAVFVFARRSFWAFSPIFFIFIVVYLFSYGAQFVLAQQMLVSLPNDVINVGIAGLGIFRLLALTGMLIAWLNFYLDIVIVTNERLVDIDQEQIFSRSISELDLTDIEDVTSEVRGFSPTLFNYGTVFIQTAGAQDKFIMEHIRYPREVAALTLSLSEQAKHGVPDRQRVPETDVIAVINGKPYTTIEQLKAIEAFPINPPVPPV